LINIPDPITEPSIRATTGNIFNLRGNDDILLDPSMKPQISKLLAIWIMQICLK